MKKSNIFWIGYSDLMTSLFFVMLVLFVVTIGFLQYRIKTTEEELKKIQELQSAVQELPEEYFEYQPQFKRFNLKSHVQFPSGDSIIPNKDYEYLIKVGRSIESLIDDLRQNEELNKLDIKYLVIIEGMASKDDYKLNYDLSYKRALSLYWFWLKNGIKFDPDVCEIQISGSGTRGIGREKEEKRNQQLLIHIIPKLGTVEMPGENDITIEEKTEEVIVKEEIKEERIVEESSPSTWENEYDSIGEFDQVGIAIVRVNKKFGSVNRAGEEIFPVNYDYIDRSGERGLYIVGKDEKIGIINESGRLITPLKYEGIGEWSEGLAMVISNDRCGYINISGEEVIPLSYNSCAQFNSGRAKVLYKGKEIYINAQGNYAGKVEQ